MSNLANVYAVLPVSDHAASVAWYANWLGRGPDIVAIPDAVVEWKIAENAWIQVFQAEDPAVAGKSSVVIGVADIDTQVSSLADLGVTAGEIVDYGFIRLSEVADPDGNKINFVWENPDFDPSAAE